MPRRFPFPWGGLSFLGFFCLLSWAAVGCPSEIHLEAHKETITTESKEIPEKKDATEGGLEEPPTPQEAAHEKNDPDLAEPPDRPSETATHEIPPEAAQEKTMRIVTSYVALGSSSTQGAGASDPLKTAYVPRLFQRLEALSPGIALLNLGAGGARVSAFLQQIPQIQQAAPQILTVLPLTDYAFTPAKDFQAQYTKLFDALQPLQATLFFGDLRIDPNLVCGRGKGPTGLCYDPADEKALSEKNAILAALAKAYTFLQIVPVFDPSVAHPSWNANDGHPNDLGHLYLADTFWAAIQPWLASPP